MLSLNQKRNTPPEDEFIHACNYVISASNYACNYVILHHMDTLVSF
jgi:hypothetical protein